MRDAVTTALEVAGMICFAVAIALLTYAWAGFAVAGLFLFAAGVLEGRKP
jgi:hypothetical protein